MGNSIFAQAAQFIRDRRDNRRWQAAVCCLATLVVCGTTWALVRQVQALNNSKGDVLDCKYEVHEHIADCYEDERLVCGKVEYVVHTHDEDICYDEDGELVCLLPEEEGHVHDADCFVIEESLVCELEESETDSNIVELSDESSGEQEGSIVSYAQETELTEESSGEQEGSIVSYAQGTELTCGQEEHRHDDKCYEVNEVSKLDCGQEEHSHKDECYDEEGTLICKEEEHEHDDDDCYKVSEESKLICEQEEHTHSDNCYDSAVQNEPAADDTGSDQNESTTNDTGSDQNEPAADDTDIVQDEPATGHTHSDECYLLVRELTCGEEGIHTHDADCYQDDTLICTAPVVKSLEEHVHDSECFVPGEDEEYIQIFKNDDIRVTATYRTSAGIPKSAKMEVEQITDKNDERYVNRLEELEEADGALADDEEPAMLLGFVFYTIDERFLPEDTVNLQVQFLNDNIYTEGDKVTVASFGGDGVELISGTDIDEDGTTTFDVENLSEIAFITSGEDSGIRKLVYEGEDYIVTVALEEDSAVPEDAELIVEQITDEDTEAYEEALERLDNAGVLEGNEIAAMLLAMKIYAKDVEIVPDETLEVKVQFLNREIYFEGDAVKAAHLTEDAVELLDASDIDDDVSTTFTVDELAEFAFITDGDIRTLTAEGEDYIITVRFSPKAKIPEDAELAAERITEESDPDKFTEREDQLQDEIADKLIALSALFDISFYDADGTEIEPQSVVEVKIQLLDTDDIKEADSVKVAHFVEDKETAEESIEIIEDADVTKDGDGGLSTSFQTESFSTYAIAVDGEVIDASRLRKAFAIAQDGDTVQIQDDIVFTKTNDGAIPITKSVTLDLNGYTITVDGSVTLFNVAVVTDETSTVAALYIKDTSTNKSVTKDQVAENSAPTSEYDNNKHHLNSMTCYVTESIVINSSTGATREDTYAYKVEGHGAIVGSKSNESPLLFVKDGGTLELDGGVIVMGNGDRAVEVRNAEGATATLNLHDCYLVDNTATRKSNGSGQNSSNGGAIYGGDKCEIYIYDGAIISGNEGNQGGGIYAENVIINMNGGYITNNTSTFGQGSTNYYGPGGGGMYLSLTEVNMTNGYVTGNIAYAGGGGIALGGVAKNGQGIVQINGGTIASNVCAGYHGEGGGIALYDESIIEINYKASDGTESGPVYISNNKVIGTADWGGGGLFVGQNSSATLFDTLITENSAEGFGGGLGGCSTGRVVETNSNKRGAAIFDNSAAGQVYAGNSTKNEDYDYSHSTPAFWERDDRGRYYFQDLFSILFSSFEDSMLGGGREQWDGTVDGVRINVNDSAWQSSFITGLTAFPSDPDKKLAEESAHVYIHGNYSAVHGGGIMCNGIMVIGENEGQIEIITSMELTGTKKLVDSADENIGITDEQAGQFTFTIYPQGALKEENHTHTDTCKDTAGNYVCGLEEGEPVFLQHVHNPDCYTILEGPAAAGGKKWVLICDKGAITTGTNGADLVMARDEEGNGNVTVTEYHPDLITFDSLLTFDLQRDLGKDKNEISAGEQHTYVYYIKEDETTEASRNVEIERDRTVYRMEVTVEKKFYENIGLSKIAKYYDDIVQVKVHKTVKGDGGTWSWSPDPVKTITNGLHNQFHTIKINLNDFSGNGAAFTNKKTGVQRIEVTKSWDYDYGLDNPAWKKEDEVEWVSVALFMKGEYGYNDTRIEDGDYEGETTTWPGEMTKWKDKELGRLYLKKENNWTDSWDNLPADFPIADIEVREIDIKYTDEKWKRWGWDQEAIGKLKTEERIEPAVWSFEPKYTYTNEGGVAKVIALNIPKTFGISFTKIGYNDAQGNPVGNGKNGAIYGAKFEIYSWNDGTWSTEPLLFEQVNGGYSFIDEGVVTNRRTTRQLTTDINGELSISNLWWGRFLIKEVEAPVGFKPIHDHVVDFNGTTATEKVSCLIDGKETPNNSWTNPDTKEVTKGTESVCPVFVAFAEGEQKNNAADNGSQYFDYVDDVLIFKMIDPEDKYELPETGGFGIVYLGILGAVLFFGTAAVTYTTYRRRREN